VRARLNEAAETPSAFEEDDNDSEQTKLYRQRPLQR
jgi:hypothetical protein